MEFVDARFELFVDNLERTISFYEDVLALEAQRYESGYVDLRGRGVAIGLGSPPGASAGSSPQASWS